MEALQTHCTNLEYEMTLIQAELNALQGKVHKGALFEVQTDYMDQPEFLVCPDCGVDVLVYETSELALCPDCHTLPAYHECDLKGQTSRDTHEVRSKEENQP